MGIYIILYLSMAVVGYLFCMSEDNPKTKRIFFIFFFGMVMIILQAIRADSVAADTSAYLDIFERIANCPWDELREKFSYEIGYVYLNKIISSIFNYRQIILGIVAIIVITGISLYFLKESANVYLSLLLFLGTNHFFSSMSSLRQYIALVFVSFSFLCAYKGIKVKSCVWALLAILFHQTSIVPCSCILVILFFGSSRKTLLLTTLLALLVYVFSGNILSIVIRVFPKYEYYLSPDKIINEVGIGEIRIIFILIELACIIFIMISRKNNTQKLSAYAMFLVMGVLVGLLQRRIPYIWRIEFYFDFALTIVIPEFLYGKQRIKYVLSLIIMVGVTIYFVYLLFHNLGVIPYKVYFEV